MTPRRHLGLARASGLGVVLLAVVAAAAPRPAGLVERLYAAGLYPGIQAALTGASNFVPIALFDVVLVVASVSVVWLWGRALGQARRTRQVRPIEHAVWVTLFTVSASYLWFLAAWGLNYARPPIDQRLGLPAGPATTAEVAALLRESVAQVNALHATAHMDGFIPYDAERDVTRTLHAVEAAHGRPRPTIGGRPKPTLLGLYFRMAGVDGLTAPAALETLLNPDLTPYERPFVLAHEWAHLAGYAPEADANFVGWLATTHERAEPRTRYSGWLFLLMETAAQVPRDVRQETLQALGAGPRADLAAIAARVSQRVDVVQRVGWRVYDSYLKSQGVPEGIVSYSRVVDLIVRASRATATPQRTPRAVPQ